MTTEIRFLLDLVLEHKLPPEAKRLCLERIGQVEASLQQPINRAPFSSVVGAHPPQGTISVMQAPSTQRLLDAAPLNIATAAPLAPPVTARIVGGEVNTGSGTKGPRKF